MDSQLTTRRPDALVAAGQAANGAAARYAFTDYRERKSEHTRTAQDGDLMRFTDFLKSIGAPIPADLSLNIDPDAWHGITYGLIKAFVRWQLERGYAIATVNRSLATLKVYARLAMEAGILSDDELARIRTVTGYARREAKQMDTERKSADVPIRRPSAKKPEHTRLDAGQAKTLKTAHDTTAQGRRDALLMCLLLELGLRCGEVALLDVASVDLKAGTLTFHRPKVDKVQTHTLPSKGYLKRALKAYFEQGDAPAAGKLLRASHKDGKLTKSGMSPRAITGRVRRLGSELLGIEDLSAHDCRHYWATNASKSGTDPFALQEAGGWNSLAMPRRYVEDARIANEGVKQDFDDI